MAVLPLVGARLDAMAANFQPYFGEHDSYALKPGQIGSIMSEVDFDPSRHGPELIRPLSVWEQIVDVRQVAIVAPEYPLPISVVIDQSDQNDHPGILKAKQLLGKQLLRCFDQSALVSDEVTVHLIGGNKSFTRDYRTETIPEDQAVARINEICQAGLTFIVSDFKRVITDPDSGNFPATVAVKINHPYEVALPTKSGKITLGAHSDPVNTNKSKELTAFNNDLARSHQVTMHRLQIAGIWVAQVLFDATKITTLGIDLLQADTAIAAAMNGFENL